MVKTLCSILVVEQNPAMLEKLCSAFLSAGFDVRKAGSFDSAIKLINEGNPFRLMLLDISGDCYSYFIESIHDMEFPVLTVRNDLDKSLIIDMLTQGNTEFIERFMEMNKVPAGR